MDILITYLICLRNKIFKLLPMREAHDKGEENHLGDYLENLYVYFDGGFGCYPELTREREIIEALGNVAFLKNNSDIDFKKWRSIILRSIRLVNAVASKYSGGVEI